MKKAIKVIAILLVACMVIPFMAACGNTTTSGAGGSPASSAAATGGAAGSGSKTITLTGKDPYKQDVKIAFIPMSASGLNMAVNQLAIDDFVTAWVPYGGHVKVTVFDCANDTSTQVSLVSEATVQKFDAIVIEPKDQTALNTVLTDAEKAGIVVIKENQGADAVVTLHVKSDSYSAGYIAGKGLTKLMNNKGNVVLLDCPAGQVASTTFSKGYKDYIAAYPDVKIIDYQNCKSFSQEDAYTVMADMLTKHDNINAVYAISDDMAAGAIQAIEAAGRKNILVWGAGCKPSGIANIKAGKEAGTTWPDIYTTVTISLNSALQYVIAGVNGYKLGYTQTPLIVEPMQMVTAENIDKIIPFARWPEAKK